MVDTPIKMQPSADYLAYFNLSDDPFAPDPEPFFAGGARGELFPRLLNLCQFSADTVAVIGDEGVGKSALKTALIEHLDDSDQVCAFNVPLLSDRPQIVRMVAESFGIPTGDSTDAELVKRLKTLGREPGYREALKVILVDDAHQLDDASLQMLSELVEPRDDPHCQFHLVFFGEPSLRERMADTDEDEGADAATDAERRNEETTRAHSANNANRKQRANIQWLELKPLSKADLRAYLRFRMDAVGFKGVFPFKDQDIDYLWNISRGLPGEVHDEARNILLEMAMPPPEPRSLGLPPIHMGLIIVLVTLLVIALFYRGNDPGHDPDSEIVDEVAGSNSAATDSIAVPEIVDRDVAQAESTTGSSTNENDSATRSQNQTQSPRPAASQPTPAEPPVTPAEPSTEISDTPAASAKPAEPSIAQATGPDTGTTEAEASPPPSAAASSTLTTDERTLLAMDPDAFTLQVLAAASKASVDDFVARQPNRDDLAVFAARRDGEVFYIIVAGRYANADAARAAVAGLPAEQRQAGPWPRPIRSVQADIRQYRSL